MMKPRSLRQWCATFPCRLRMPRPRERRISATWPQAYDDARTRPSSELETIHTARGRECVRWRDGWAPAVGPAADRHGGIPRPVNDPRAFVCRDLRPREGVYKSRIRLAGRPPRASSNAVDWLARCAARSAPHSLGAELGVDPRPQRTVGDQPRAHVVDDRDHEDRSGRAASTRLRD